MRQTLEIGGVAITTFESGKRAYDERHNNNPTSLSIFMHWREFVSNRMRRIGYDIVRFPLLRYLKSQEVNVVLDVGANTGQYAKELRELGYDDRIVSFEPLSQPFTELSKKAAADPAMEAVHLALGKEEAEIDINVSENTVSSSFLEMLPEHKEIVPSSGTVKTEKVQVKTLDQVFPDHVQNGDNAFLKIDTQGFERDVIEGATEALAQLKGLQVELTLSPLYTDQPLIEDIIALLRPHGMVPVWIEHGFKDPKTQYLKQVDGIFMKN